MRVFEDGKNRRILVIDDNPAIHDDFRKILTSDGADEELNDAEAALFGEAPNIDLQLDIEIDSANQGQEGLEKVVSAVSENRPYAMAFVDMRMPPGWDGLTTIQHLWKEDANLQVVICTAYSDNSWSDICRQLGRTDQLLILKKPFDNAEVCQLTLTMTEKWNLARRDESQMEQMERTVAERTRKIAQAHRETESLLDSISSLLIGVDEFGVVYRWNASAKELFGVSSSEAVGKLLSELDINWADLEAVNHFFNASISGATTRHTLMLVENGSPRMIGASRYPVNDNGVNRGFLCLGMDVTKQYQIEQQLRQAQKLEAVGQLAAGVAHEINTPMQYLGDNLDFLKNKMKKLEPIVANLPKVLEAAERTGCESDLVDKTRANLQTLNVESFSGHVLEAIKDSQDGVHHVSRIVRAMKEFAHPGQEEKTPVDLNRALESTIAVSTNEWKYVADIERNFEASLPLVPAMAGELNQVFLNILVNAAHAVGDTNDGGASGKGMITISTCSKGERVEVSIADTGTGIPDDIKERIFDPFFTTKEIGKGTGQGLAIAHSVIVQNHGGTLHCESSAGRGTTFSIQLPVNHSDTETSNEFAAATLASDGQSSPRDRDWRGRQRLFHFPQP